jgi:photosystem II stability/assembly factor-like uncharacterized protein
MILILGILPVFIISTNAATNVLASRPVADSFAEWELLDTGLDDDYNFNEILFLNSTHGWVVGWGGHAPVRGVLLNTSDSGDTWYTQLQSEYSLRGLTIVDSTDIWVGGSGLLFHSLDGGSTWTNASGPTELPTNVEFYNSTHGIAGDVRGMYRTTDGGNTWQNITMASSHDFPDDFHLTSRTIRIASGDGIIRSDDWGDHWQVELTGNVRAMDFITEEEAWAINWDSTFSYFSGDQWSNMPRVGRLRALSSSRFYDIDFVDSNHGWAVGKLPSVAYTPDGGKTWYEQEWYNEEILVHSFMSVDFINETHGWAAGWEGVITRTQTGSHLGPRLYLGLFISHPIRFGGVLIPYFSLLVGAVITVIYSSGIGMWIYRQYRTRRISERNL